MNKRRKYKVQKEEDRIPKRAQLTTINANELNLPVKTRTD